MACAENSHFCKNHSNRNTSTHLFLHKSKGCAGGGVKQRSRQRKGPIGATHKTAGREGEEGKLTP